MHIRDSVASEMVGHYDSVEAARTPKQRRFIDGLNLGKNEVLGKNRLKKGTGSSICVGLHPTERYSCIDGVWAWRKLR